MRAVTIHIVSWGIVAAALAGCGQHVEPIDLHDETIPVQARKLVADAEDSVDIARAKLDTAERELEKTKEWRRELLERDWPDEAQSILPKLEEFSSARVRLARLEVRRARQNVRYARAKFELITAKTAIRNDLAIYELAPIRAKVDREKRRVDQLDAEILSQRKRIAQLENKWWKAYASFAGKGGETRAFFVSSVEELPSPDLREVESEQEDAESSSSEESGNTSGELPAGD